jgi:hypothetical protein
MFKSILSAATVAVALFGAPSASQAATLTGATVDVEFFFPNLATSHCSLGSAVVGAGVEYPSECGGYAPNSIDVTATQVIFSSVIGFSAGDFNGFVMSILSGPTVTSASYNAALSTMSSTSLTFDASSISFNFAGNIGQGGGTAVFDIGVAAVPLPAALPLLAAGLGILGFAGRRRKTKTAA